MKLGWLPARDILDLPRRRNAALNNMSQALMMYDASGGLVVCNQRYHEMYGLSPDIIKPGMHIREALAHRKRTGTFPEDPEEHLEIEITESVPMQNTGATLAALRRLRELGVRISMDDFGTGYSSLRYLRSFPFDKIKIDRCFISGLSDGDDSVAIVMAIASLARNLGIVTTAEGVETEEELQQVKALGCSEMQGYLFSPPRPVEEIRRLLGPCPGAKQPATEKARRRA